MGSIPIVIRGLRFFLVCPTDWFRLVFLVLVHSYMLKTFSSQVSEQEQFLESHVVHFGIGTPSRILNLIQNGEWPSLLEEQTLNSPCIFFFFLYWGWGMRRGRGLKSFGLHVRLQSCLPSLMCRVALTVSSSPKIFSRQIIQDGGSVIECDNALK